MNEENNDVTTEAAPQSEPAASLDDLYGEFQPQQTQPVQSQQQTQPQPQSTVSYSAPDPVSDPDGFKNWTQSNQREIADLKSSLTQYTNDLAAEKQALAEQQEERDFQSVASEIAKSANINADDAEAGLLHKFMKDKNFQQIWRNRGSNPAAFQKVKTVLSNEMKGRFSSRVDSQLAENQRALDEANKSTSTSKKDEPTLEDQVAGMSSAEFKRFSRGMRNRSGFGT